MSFPVAFVAFFCHRKRPQPVLVVNFAIFCSLKEFGYRPAWPATGPACGWYNYLFIYLVIYFFSFIIIIIIYLIIARTGKIIAPLMTGRGGLAEPSRLSTSAQDIVILCVKKVLR